MRGLELWVPHLTTGEWRGLGRWIGPQWQMTESVMRIYWNLCKNPDRHGSKSFQVGERERIYRLREWWTPLSMGTEAPVLDTLCISPSGFLLRTFVIKTEKLIHGLISRILWMTLANSLKGGVSWLSLIHSWLVRSLIGGRGRGPSSRTEPLGDLSLSPVRWRWEWVNL